ncbi:penicillin-binding protein 1A [Aurantiacibacter gangjinensis]|uniref:peptidoglycan glycosyltransferase n=1 Tax=Aurantiacibacter gangjinensis TaxID=502682 RepID=A0A0G9MQW4_9SPHN|nr:transglycosylase domain-containing protein [Aurantiacibacter gangjinensis]APE28856.1 Multimodular transpeptidase-transglycosylase [Aurantiacibacter gangjinensis]KLE32994.1 penicillin-binding protein [Aurantiacibacter gangjinensis]
MSDTAQQFGGVFSRIGDAAARAWAPVARLYRERRLVRWATWLLVAALAVLMIGYVWLTRDLPDAETLLDYEPNLPTVVRGIDGEIVHRYERERRVELQFRDMPEQLLNAYISAEDETFWTHNGIDAGGFVNATFDYLSKMGSGERAVGGSTITQQVAKNILVGNEYSVTRKLREMVLATRIEDVLSKEEIITLYLNEIPLGRRSYGVQAAARAYFDKDVDELELHEMAYLAILPRAPEVYSRSANFDTAKRRRDMVLTQMEDNGFITAQQMQSAQSQPLGLVQGQRQQRSADAGYFLEEVRRQLIERYGEQAEDGENSVYAGGLWVRTSLDTELQDGARNALRSAMMRYHGNRGWAGAIATLNPDNGSLTSQLASSYLSVNYEDWRVGVITANGGGSATIGFSDGEEAPISGVPSAAEVGDVVVAQPSGNSWRLRTIPGVSGGFLAMAPDTGRVLAMQGGFDSRLGDFNRATQANRQPGSTVKPFVYATGLDAGMTPASMIPDSQYCYYQGANLGEKCFTNFGGGRGGGEYPMRYGLEQSKNLMTVHIAMESGMENVIDTFRDAGLEPDGVDYQPYPAFSLGAGDTTVERITAAYAMMVNHGRLIEPTVIDYVQDRDGRVIWRADERECVRCNMEEWDGEPMPRFGRRGRQVMDARTAFQTVHMLTGVVERGTATRLRDLDIPMFGKTGTSTGPTNAWFVGGSPDIVAGTYLGFDQPRNMGGYIQGGNTAAPIMRQFVQETREHWSGRPFIAPEGVRMVRIDRRTGRRVFDGWPTGEPTAGVIWEAFKPDTEPRRSQRQDEIDAMRNLILAQLRRQQQGPAQSSRNTSEQEDFAEEQGGIY